MRSWPRRKPWLYCLVVSLLVMLLMTTWVRRSPVHRTVKSPDIIADLSQLMARLNKSQQTELSQLLHKLGVSHTLPGGYSDYIYHLDGTSCLPSRRHILLVTFGRSGSSFTSALVQGHRDVFYFFEPLTPLERKYLARVIRRKGDREFRYGEAKRSESLKPIRDIFLHCTPKNASFIAHYNNMHSPSTREMQSCFRKEIRGGFHLMCYLKAVSQCQSKPVTFIKTIRLRMSWTEELLKLLPDLKVLYLYRDPRAVMVSMENHVAAFTYAGGPSIATRAVRHCEALGEDVAAFRRLSRLYPGRLKALRYEDGALDPLTYAANIYRFLELDLSDDVKTLVESLTSGVNTDPSLKAVHRGQPAERIWQWRGSLDWGNVSSVDKTCGFIYPALGYLPIHSEEELKYNNSAVTRPDPDTGLL